MKSKWSEKGSIISQASLFEIPSFFHFRSMSKKNAFNLANPLVSLDFAPALYPFTVKKRLSFSLSGIFFDLRSFSGETFSILSLTNRDPLFNQKEIHFWSISSLVLFAIIEVVIDINKRPFWGIPSTSNLLDLKLY